MFVLRITEKFFLSIKSFNKDKKYEEIKMRLKILNPSAEIELFYKLNKCPSKPSFSDNGWAFSLINT